MCAGRGGIVWGYFGDHLAQVLLTGAATQVQALGTGLWFSIEMLPY